jgi:formamidopyrimidine-DNA glycosylase
MPELPEVETVVRQLQQVLRRRTLLELEILDRKLKHLPPEDVRGCRVVRVCRLGKQIVFELSREKAAERRYLAVHLRMSGCLFWKASASQTRRRAGAQLMAFQRKTLSRLDGAKYLRAVFWFTGGSVCFADPRRFGTIRLARDIAQFEPRGLDPLSEQFSDQMLAGLLRGSKQPIKPWLLRQDRLVGIGNIYASEILFAARIDPRRAVGALGREEIRALRVATKKVLLRAILANGTTFSDFQDTAGDAGNYGRFLRVYGRESEDCRRCRLPLSRIVQQGRSTYFCDHCQR